MARFIMGIQPVRELLRAKPASIHEVLIEDGSAQMDALARFCTDSGVKVSRVEGRELDSLTKNGRHQGVLAKADELVLVKLQDLPEDPAGLYILLDELEDPQNFGAIVRSAVAMGATCVFWPEHRAAPLSAAMFRASAGAVEHAQLCRVAKLQDAIHHLKSMGVSVYGLDMEGATPIATVDMTGPIALVVGAEGKGLRKPIKGICDGLVSLPMPGPIGSMNASVAAALAMYEVVRQRGQAAN